MVKELTNLLKFIEGFSFNDSAYFSVHNLYEGGRDWEVICWVKDNMNSKAKWTYNLKGSPPSEPLTIEELLEQLEEVDMDFENFNILLSSRATTIIGYTAMVEAKAEELLGSSFVLNSKKTMTDFTTQLVSVVNKLLNKTRLTVVE